MLCKECGANLPDEARFCHQCGASISVEPVTGPPVPPPDHDFVRPAIAGGTFLGLLSSLPLISAGNCLCCMWIIGGGSIATYMLAQQQPRRKLTYGDGAFAGVASGMFGAVIATLVSIPLKLLSARFMESQQQSIEQMFRGFPEMEGPMRDLLIRMLSPELTVVTVVANFISNLIIYALFAMIGGIMTVAVLERKDGGVLPPSR